MTLSSGPINHSSQSKLKLLPNSASDKHVVMMHIWVSDGLGTMHIVILQRDYFLKFSVETEKGHFSSISVQNYACITRFS